jgi:hypothetical protein
MVMRLALDDSFARADPDAVRTLKRIERELSDELAGILALVALDPSLALEDALERGAQFAGLLGPPEHEISEEEARSVLAGVMERDLAYRAPRAGAASAASTAAAFLALFRGPDARFFTNGELGLTHSLGKTGGWDPLTRATFDTGVVALEKGRLGVFWVEDED